MAEVHAKGRAALGQHFEALLTETRAKLFAEFSFCADDCRHRVNEASLSGRAGDEGIDHSLTIERGESIGEIFKRANRRAAVDLRGSFGGHSGRA